LDAQSGAGSRPATGRNRALAPAALPAGLDVSIYEDLAAVEREWRAFAAQADGTVFQSFDWLACWQRHIGALGGVQPAIVVVRDAAGAILLLLPLSVRARGFARELTFLGTDLCDYNAPLLAPEFSQRFDRAQFLALWEIIVKRPQEHPRLRFDLVDLTKMPATVGTQPNPLLALPVAAHASGAYLTRLAGDWDSFYAAKRSSATRRRDRTKRKRLAESGAVNFVTPTDDADIRRTLDIMMAQKARAFAHMGVRNLFARPGYAEFYRAVATDPAMRPFVHVSRLDVGATPAAVNLGLIDRGCYYHLQASYDDGEISRFGPGAAHLHDLLHYAIDRGLTVFDFTIGDERYKRDWCDTELTLYDAVMAASWRGALLATPMRAALRLKRWIKQTPTVWKAFSAARAWLGWRARRG
jgi:CelD/BcsL family acetyltransferase involved in cellulose biosynthesis